MTNKSISQKWLEAGIALGKNPYLTVKCPCCENASLKVTDASYKDNSGFDRYLSCPKCGKYNVLSRMKNKE